jgi:hypothetical protein
MPSKVEVNVPFEKNNGEFTDNFILGALHATVETVVPQSTCEMVVLLNKVLVIVHCPVH